FSNLPGRDALDVHLRHSEQESLFATNALLQSAWVELNRAADLRNAEPDGAQARGEGLWFKTISMAQSLFASLIGLSSKDGRTLLKHGFVYEHAQALGKGGGSIGAEKLQNSIQNVRVGLVGHVCVLLVVFVDTSTEPHWPAPGELGATLPSGGYARLATLAFATPPEGSVQPATLSKLQKDFYTPCPRRCRELLQVQTGSS